MKIVSLNTWGGRAGHEALLEFFKVQSHDVDIFCLQEIWRAPYEHLDGRAVGGVSLQHAAILVEGLQQISAVLPEYDVYFRPHHLENYGLTMFVKKGIKVLEEGELFVHKFKEYMPEGDIGHHARNIQYVTVATEHGTRTIINFHGLWNGKGKGDSDDRLAQSDKIVAFLRERKNPFVFVGDFNLLPDTESIARIEAAPSKNLIKEYGITSTRTSLYVKPEKFADYAFTSPELIVQDFKVLPDEVSDHAPLYIEIA